MRDAEMQRKSKSGKPKNGMEGERREMEGRKAETWNGEEKMKE
jgi:hypothetical protein